MVAGAAAEAAKSAAGSAAQSTAQAAISSTAKATASTAGSATRNTAKAVQSTAAVLADALSTAADSANNLSPLNRPPAAKALPKMASVAAEMDGLTVLPLPARLSICIMVVGTHGDINPFLGLADRLVALGHRVRVATHAQHRRLVLARSHDFYPLAGDARKLSQWMVQTGGTVLGEASPANLRSLPEKTQMTQDIIRSTWPACTAPSPDDVEQRPFEADAVIANPPVFGHIHVAEALGVPLHIMFPQPWYYGTRAYPHPCIGLPYNRQPNEANFRSYAGFEGVAWSSMEQMMNGWRRKVLDVPVVHFGMGASALIPDAGVSFSAMWSPAFVPKPEDWPEQVRVVGTFTDKKVVEQSIRKQFDVTPFRDLIAWLDQPGQPAPIFVGFGSMVIDDPTHLAELIMSAADKAQCRVVVQSSWTKIDVGASSRCHMVGPCPHDWLLPQMGAVVHHGGAGTTAAGLRWSKPTFICPFFGDQHMWGDMVRRAGVGPPPCPVGKLTDDILAANFEVLLDETTVARASELADQMNAEDGIQGGLDHFLADLPRDNMLCDVSLLLGEARVAKFDVWGRSMSTVALTVESGLKVSTEVAAVLKSWGFGPSSPTVTSMEYFKAWLRNANALAGVNFRRHAITTYALGRVRDFKGGIVSGLCGFWRHIGLALIQLFYRPDAWSRRFGVLGCLFGLAAAPFYIVYESLRAVIVVLDRWFTGCANGCCHKDKLAVLDHRREARVHETGKTIPAEVNEIWAHGITKERKKEIYRAGEVAFHAKAIFLHAFPRYPEGHWHYKVVCATNLLEVLKDPKYGNRLKLNRWEMDGLTKLLYDRGEADISFSMFLLLLRHAIENTESPRPIGTSTRGKIQHRPEPGDWYTEMFGNPVKGIRGSLNLPYGLTKIDEESDGEDKEEASANEEV